MDLLQLIQQSNWPIRPESTPEVTATHDAVEF